MPITISEGANLLTERRGVVPPGSPLALLNHPAQSAAPIDGWKAVLFGLPFLLTGIGIALAALNVVNTRKNVPDWLIGLIGCFFFAAGACLIIHGLRGAARKAAYQADAAEHPGQPWLSDHHWHRTGITFSAFHAMLSRLVAALIWNAFLIPFFWVGLNAPGMARIFLFFASLLALIGLIFWGRWLQMLGELIRYGNSFLSYDDFPYFLGQKLHARLRAAHQISALDELTVTLRCVQEKYVTSSTGDNRSICVVCFELYKDSITLSRDQIAGLAGGDIPIEFSLPENQKPTLLADAPPTYWEIQARGFAHRADYEAYFLVPVYARP